MHANRHFPFPPGLLRALALGALLLCGAAACGKKTEPPPPAPAPAPAPAPQAVRVTQVEIGNAIGPDKRVTAPTRSFAPTDTLYVSVATDGSAASAALRALWTYEDGQVVDDSTQNLAPTGPVVTEFHLSKPDGWPAGGYQVEIQLDGATVATESFSVAAP
jgi:hypothetical protein